MVFYRLYRPQTIDDLDEQSVRETLHAVLSSSKIPHAFLFTGPKGLGKTSTARIIAKAVNCEKRKASKEKTIEPCNKCDACLSITNGTNVDVLELDGASNRGIDEIRDLREKVRLLPANSLKKVYIIDEVHMLTGEAFNALLKTIEEPPPHVLFILCTTEPQKVPPTILSRCLHIVFHLAKPEELVRSFQRIAKAEKLSIEKDALFAIAHLSDGSFRDGAKVLEELVLLSGGKLITKKLIEEKYHVQSSALLVSDLLQFLSEKNTKKSLDVISQVVNLGIDSSYFLGKLMEALHAELLAKVGVGAESKTTLSLDDITALSILLQQAYRDTKYAVVPQMPLEIAVVEWTVGKGSGDVLSHAGGDAHKPNTKDENSTHSLIESRLQSGQKNKVISRPTFSSPPGGQDIAANAGKGTGNFDWYKFIDKVKERNHALAGVLRGCQLKSQNGQAFVIEALYKFHKERLEQRESLQILEDILQTLTGKAMQVSVLLKGGE